MKSALPSRSDLLLLRRVVQGLLEARDDAERRLAKATDRASWLRADGTRGALDRVLNDLARGESIAELKAEMAAVFGVPCPLEADQRKAFHPFTGADLGAMRDDIHREVIALLDQLQVVP